MNPTELCGTLLVGSVAAAEAPELAEEGTREEVRRRLAEAGCELVWSAQSERWLARLAAPLPALETHEPVLRLGDIELAVLAVCWLHLRFLAAERNDLLGKLEAALAEDDLEPTPTYLDPEDLAGSFEGRLDPEQVGEAVGVLRRAGFLVLHEGQLHAGPLLDTLDSEVAGEHARALVERHRRLTQLERQAAALRTAAALRSEGGSDAPA